MYAIRSYYADGADHPTHGRSEGKIVDQGFGDAVDRAKPGTDRNNFV